MVMRLCRAFLSLMVCLAVAQQPDRRHAVLNDIWLRQQRPTRPGVAGVGLMQLGAETQRRLTRRQIALQLGSGVEELQDYQDNKLAVTSTLSEDRISSIVGSITKQSYESELNNFVNNQRTRYINTAGNAKAAEYIKKQFDDFGYDTMVQDVEAGGTKNPNIIGYKKGKHTDEFVIVGAHLDSVNWEDTKADAPGAEDNASGSAGLLQLARSLKDVDTDRSVAFVAFNGEEEGTLGSQRFVQELQKKDRGAFAKFGTPRSALIMDEVAYPSPTKGHERKAIFETKGDQPAYVSLIDTAYRSYEKENSIVKGVKQNLKGFGSDHIPICTAGIPALLFIERDNMQYADKFGHSARDTLDHVDYEFGAAMSRIVGRTLLALANEKKEGQPGPVDVKAHQQQHEA